MNKRWVRKGIWKQFYVLKENVHAHENDVLQSQQTGFKPLRIRQGAGGISTKFKSLQVAYMNLQQYIIK